MIGLPNAELSADAHETLNTLQDQIDGHASFSAQVIAAKELWKNKGGARNTFIQIRDQLRELCQFEGVCMYCEHAEATDIEHVFPKSYFPSRTFLWDNYLLACKNCNSGFKLDACSVLDSQNNLFKVPRGEQPPSDRLAFINPRFPEENPRHFFWLNTETFAFEVEDNLLYPDEIKAKETLRILALNNRDVLIAARKAAYNHYFLTLRQLSELRAASNIEELKQSLTPNEDRFDLTQTLEALKEEVTQGYRNYITQYQHPSVWMTIKEIEAKTDHQWKALFDQIPEALEW